MEAKAFAGIEKCAYLHSFNAHERAKSKNVDPALTPDNVMLENAILEARCRDEREYVNRFFQPAIDAYNEKQKRTDRKITVPYSEYWASNENLSGKKNTKKRPKLTPMLSYELACGFGDHEQLGSVYYDLRYEIKALEEKGSLSIEEAALLSDKKEKLSEIKNIFVSVAEQTLADIKKEFPHLKIMYASIHFDEPMGTPHMQAAFIPVCDDVKKGLPINSSIGGALRCDGIDRVPGASKDEYQFSRFFDSVREKIADNVEKFLEQNPDFRVRGEEIKMDRTKGDGVHQTKDEWLHQKELKKENDALELQIKKKNIDGLVLTDKYNNLVDEYNAVESARDTVKADRDTANAERDTANAERDAARAERDAYKDEIATLIKQTNANLLAYRESEKRLNDAIDREPDWTDFLVRTGRAELIEEHRNFVKQNRYHIQSTEKETGLDLDGDGRIGGHDDYDDDE